MLPLLFQKQLPINDLLKEKKKSKSNNVERRDVRHNIRREKVVEKSCEKCLRK